MSQMDKIADNLSRELSIHSVEEKKKAVAGSKWWDDPFGLSKNIHTHIRYAQEEMMYLGCYLACRTGNMKYMYDGIYQGNRLNAAWEAGLATGTDHGRFFFSSVLSFACNDYELIEKLLPCSIGNSVNDVCKEMANLLIAIYYKDGATQEQALAEARRYLSKKRAKYERLITEYMIALLEKDVRSAGTLLNEICGLIGQVNSVQESCAGFGKRALGKCICLLGHGFYAMAEYYLDADELAGFEYPEHETFLPEYERYRRESIEKKRDALVAFDRDKSFLNDVIELIPEVALIHGGKLVYQDADGFLEQLYDKLRKLSKLQVLEKTTKIEWIAKWCKKESFFSHYRRGDEKKSPLGRGLIYYALANSDLDTRYEISKFLLENGADISPVEKEWDGPFHYLFRQKEHDILQTVELCKMLLRAGADPNQAGARNYLPVHYLMMMEYPESELKPLYDFWLAIPDLNISLHTFDGFLPYDIAKKYGRNEMMKRLKELSDGKLDDHENGADDRRIKKEVLGRVLLVKVPDDKLKTLARVKMVFELDMTTRELLEGSKHLPFTIVEEIPEIKAESIIVREAFAECLCFEALP